MSLRKRLWSAWTVCLLLLTASPTVVMALQGEATPVVDESPTERSNGEESPVVPFSLQSAADYCLMQNGIVVERFPFLGTSTAQPIRLDGSEWFCELTGSPEAEPPTSRITISLRTLYAPEPTLATMAYLARLPGPDLDQTEATATAYCAYLGGSSSFGIDESSSGGWASDPGNPDTTSIGICVFPDGSAIDDWGLVYNAEGVVRGADLSNIIRYQNREDFEIAFPDQ